MIAAWDSDRAWNDPSTTWDGTYPDPVTNQGQGVVIIPSTTPAQLVTGRIKAAQSQPVGKIVAMAYPPDENWLLGLDDKSGVPE